MGQPVGTRQGGGGGVKGARLSSVGTVQKGVQDWQVEGQA